MSLRLTIETSPETVSDMLFAADDRYQDAEELLIQLRFDGCVYLLGYAAEMWMKAACLQLHGVTKSDSVMASMPPLRKWMKNNAPEVGFRSYHDLAFFAECILRMRALQGRPLDSELERELRTRINEGLDMEWAVEMRYRRSALTADDAFKALEHARWISLNWNRFS